jgi:hypothetical protein
MIKRRRRFKQSVPFAERLAAWAKGVRDRAEKLPPGSPERELLIKKAQQADTASHMADLANPSGSQPPT